MVDNCTKLEQKSKTTGKKYLSILVLISVLFLLVSFLMYEMGEMSDIGEVKAELQTKASVNDRDVSKAAKKLYFELEL